MGTHEHLERLYAHLGAKHIPALDGVRMVAVFLVILYHFGFEAVPGGHGVIIFFVLSGFLITWLMLGEQAATGSVSLLGFYRRRTLRIFPAFYAFWFAVVLLGVLRTGDGPSAHAWSSFFYVSNYYSALNGHPANAFSHTWSLGIEEQFYLMWPFIFLCCRGNLGLMTRVLVAVIAGVAIHRAALTYVFEVDESYIYSAFDTRVDQLLIGALAAVLLKRRVLRRFWSRACAHPVAPVVPLALLVASVAYGENRVAHYRDVVGFTLAPLLYAVMIVQVVSLSASRTWSWLDSAPARFLGRISYPLYLYQQVTLYPVRRLLAGAPVAVQVVVAVAVTIVVASLSYYVVERRFLRLKGQPAHVGRWWRGTATAAP
jgi:peptidoglycan/LPS O-acetylase OafA/YrhL